MSLFDGLPVVDGVGSQAPEPETPYIVTIKRASTGEEIMLCNVTPPPAGAVKDAKARKLALFTLDEIPTMRSIDSSALNSIIAARRIMGWGGPVSFQGAV